MKLIFMGTPDFAVPSLEQVAKSGHELVGVVTRPDMPRGRGRKQMPPGVKVTAQDLGVPILQPVSLKDPAFQASLRELDADLFVVVAFLILPKAVLAIPKQGSVNLHPSLLPKYRGAAPIQWAVIRGETETGITIFQLSPRVDAGDMLLQEKVAIGSEETAGALYERMKEMGASLLVKAIDGIANGTVVPVSQSDEGVTRAPKLDKEDGRIDWSADAETVRNLIRGTNPFPGAFTVWRGTLLKVHRAVAVEGLGAPGQVIEADPKRGIMVGTGSGQVRLEEVQPAGKKRMNGADFVKGYGIDVGEMLG